ncbi:MAG: hypothetical protein CML12_02070 [Puniceicoccaceae bacterium]|nr:hypothetical protein [Puniceicoccaceae bacterium]
MFLLFFKSILSFLEVYLEAFSLKAIRENPLSFNRLLFLFILFPLFICLQIIHFLGFLFDDIFFREYRSCSCDRLLFIIGIPRSGTTFLHRSIAQSDQTTTLTTWESILAPSIIEKKILCTLARLDSCFGQPLKKIINRLIQSISGDFQRVHAVTVDAPEEDYLTLLPIGASAILSFAFPHSKALRKLLNFETMDAKEKATILEFYKKNIQRHLYHQDSDRLFLSKNAAFCTWLPELKNYFPRAKFILSVRNPETAIPSQLKALNSARKLFGTDPKGTRTQSIIHHAFQNNYRALNTFLANTPETDRQLICQESLRLEPELLLKQALEGLALDIKLPAGLATATEGRQSNQPKKTTQAEKDPIDPSLREYYKAIEKFAHRPSNIDKPHKADHR